MEKLSNLLCLTRYGFCVHLEEDGQFYPNMSMFCRLAEHNNGYFSNYPGFQTKLLLSLAVAAMLFFETMPVKLYGRSPPAPKTLQGCSKLRAMCPVGVKGRRVQGFLARFMAS